MTMTVEPTVDEKQLFDLLIHQGPLTVAEIAARARISRSSALSWAEAGVDALVLYRDEFGRYAPWGAWPRVGL